MFRTPAFEAFIAPARHYPQIWRIVVGLVLGVLVFFVGSLVIAAFVNALIAVGFPDAFEGYTERSTLAVVEELGVTADGMFIFLATFFAMGLAALVAAAIHWRGLASLIGPFRPACRNFSWTSLSIGIFFFVTGLLVWMFLLEDPVPSLPLATWASYLPVALPLLLVQTGAEELVFRGYLMQALAARFKSAVIWIGLPSILFGLAHFDYTFETDIRLNVITVFATGLFGLIAADLTRITGNLGAAIGFHFTNNFFALFLVTIAGEMSGLSLYHAPFTMEDVDMLVPLILFDMVTMVIAWLFLRRWLKPA